MQIIRLPKAIDIAERVLPALVADWVHRYSVKSFKIIVLQQLWQNLVVSWVIEWWKSSIPHRRTFRKFTHRVWAMWDLSNHDLYRIFPNPGSPKSVTLSLEYICTIQSQARASDVKMPKLRQHSSNCGMTCFDNIFGNFWGTWDQPDHNPGVQFRCEADIIFNLNNHEIQRPVMLVIQKIRQVSLVRCTYDCPNRRSGAKLILSIPWPIAPAHLAEDSATLRVSKAHWYKIEVHLKWDLCQMDLDKFENISVV